MLNIGLVILAFFVLTAVGGAAGGGALIDAMKRRFGAVATGVVDTATEIHLEEIVPRLRRLSWLAVGLFVVTFVISIVLACTVTVIPIWNAFVVGLIAALFSVWIIYNVGYGNFSRTNTFGANTVEFSAETLWNAIVLGFISLGAVEFIIGNAFYSRALVMLGVLSFSFGFGAFLAVVIGAVWLAANGIHIAEQASTLLLKSAVSIAKNRIEGLPPIDVQLAAEEKWVPIATGILMAFVLPLLPSFVVGILMPSLALQGVVMAVTMVMSLVLLGLERLHIDTEERRKNAMLMFEKLVYICLPVMAFIMLSTSGEAELDKLRDTFEAFATGVMSGTNAAMIKAREHLIQATIAAAILYFMWTDRIEVFKKTRGFLGILPFLALVWCGVEIGAMYFAPKIAAAAPAMAAVKSLITIEKPKVPGTQATATPPPAPTGSATPPVTPSPSATAIKPQPKQQTASVGGGGDDNEMTPEMRRLCQLVPAGCK